MIRKVLTTESGRRDTPSNNRARPPPRVPRPGPPTPQGGHRNEATKNLFRHRRDGLRGGRVGVQLLVIDLSDHLRAGLPGRLGVNGPREQRGEHRRGPGHGAALDPAHRANRHPGDQRAAACPGEGRQGRVPHLCGDGVLAAQPRVHRRSQGTGLGDPAVITYNAATPGQAVQQAIDSWLQVHRDRHEHRAEHHHPAGPRRPSPRASRCSAPIPMTCPMARRTACTAWRRTARAT